jgi:N-acyl-L-homoserine lactone synthetase
MNVIALTRPALLKHSELALEMHRLRRRVFRDRLDWKVSVSDGLEIDQYDALTPTCLLGVDRRDVVGCVRLLPTTGPNMLADTFPVLLDGRAAPKNAKIWETSRFCVNTQNVAATAENGLKEATLLLFAAILNRANRTTFRRSRPSLISAWSESCARPDGISIALVNLAKSEPPKPSPDCCRSLMTPSKRSGRRRRF